MTTACQSVLAFYASKQNGHKKGEQPTNDQLGKGIASKLQGSSAANDCQYYSLFRCLLLSNPSLTFRHSFPTFLFSFLLPIRTIARRTNRDDELVSSTCRASASSRRRSSAIGHPGPLQCPVTWMDNSCCVCKGKASVPPVLLANRWRWMNGMDGS